ncbi:MAG: Flp pilus assembly protein CpaB [Burkholderiales bacterium]
MNNTRSIVMLALAVLAGLFAVVFASQWITRQAAMNTNKIAVATLDLQLGQKVVPDAIRLVDWPVDSVPKGSFVDAKALENRFTKTSIQRGEPILESKLAPSGASGGLTAVVAEGKRAMTVRVNDVVGVAGFALPGTYVDIIVNTQGENTNKSSQEKDQSISKIVLERILVLAAAQEASRDETKPKVVSAVTLEVTPAQAEMLDLARSVGTLSLVLRNQTEMQSAQTEGATKKTMLNIVEEPVALPVVKPVVVKARPTVIIKRQIVNEPVIQYVAAAPAAVAPPVRREACVEVIRGVTKVTECF